MNLLLDACKMALEIVAGERISYDAFPPKDELSIAHDKYVRKCEEKLEQAITKAEQSIPAESRYGRDVKSEPKPLAQYLATISDMGMLKTQAFFQQALDAYESTENVTIKIERV